jgi:hypothetical protein
LSIKVTLVMPTAIGTWLMDKELPFPPFPNLGIRLDVYEVFNVDTVVVDETDHRFPIACIGHMDGAESKPPDAMKFEALGFEQGVYV